MSLTMSRISDNDYFCSRHGLLVSLIISLALVLPLTHQASTAQTLESQKNACQITAMTILAEKGIGEKDPKLDQVYDRLVQVLPGYHFQLIEGRTARLEESGIFEIKGPMQDRLQVGLQQVLNDDGKVVLGLKLFHEDQMVFGTEIRTPPNQLFFLDRKINGNQRLLIAVGAR